MKLNPSLHLKTSSRLRGRLEPVNTVASVILLGMLLALTPTARAGVAEIGGKRGLDTMTVNLYVGGGVGRAIALNPADPAYVSNLVFTVTGIYYQILSSQPPVRLAGIAETIVARMPDLVSVQEASLLRLQSPGDLVQAGSIPATNVVFDYLAILVDELAARGAHYRVASMGERLDIEMPMLNFQTGTYDDARLTDRDAILVRTDLPPGQLRVTRPQSGNFAAAIQIPAIGLTVNRGWCSVDVFMRGKLFRYINAHLEEETAAPIQLAQALELLDGPARTRLPVVLCGDFNSDLQHLAGTTTCDAILAAGFKDAWATTNPNNLGGGLTWGHDEWLADFGTSFIWQLDHVFYRGPGLFALQAEVTDMTLDRSSPPLWASDHAALGASFLFQRSPATRNAANGNGHPE
jgi:endonuclease/exonuclease/phosphatase family metal-dependent hydrolase